MRRKSSKNANSSPEKTKAESQRRSRRQSSRRRKRSSSRSSEESDEQPDVNESVQVHEENSTAFTDIKSDSDLKNSENPPSDTEQREINTEICNQEYNSVLNKEDKDYQEVGDMEEKKNKGKSKGKNISNFEQSSNNIEPEIENENVQGTHQSPSNAYADNENVVQNINDTAKFNPEAKKSEETLVAENENQQEGIFEAGFVSEYAQISESSQDDQQIIEAIKNTESEQHPERNVAIELNYQSTYLNSFHNEGRSTTPELRAYLENTSEETVDETPREKSSNQEPDKTEFNENSGSKKKITLRRSAPENKETETVSPTESFPMKTGRSCSTDESKKVEEIKPSKKISLKRHTTEDSNISEVHVDNRNISRSLSEEIVERKRRLSSLGDDKEQSREDKPKKVLKPIKLIRTLCREVKDNEEEEGQRRRQKWGRSAWLDNLTSSFYKIDVESIKIVCPSLEFLSESEVNLESTPRERKKSETDFKRKVSIDNKSDDSDRPDYEKQTSEDSSGEQKVEPNPNIIAMNRKISIVDDTASKLRPPPSPAKNPISDVLFITNLVRPFTVKQLKELLERTGTIKGEGFWTDRIKSKCYVQYELPEEAEATRNALHGVHWPIGNGKKLVIDYATVEDLQKAKNPTPTPAVPEKLPEKENKEPDRSDAKYKDREREERRKRDVPVREWDLGKEDSRRRFSRSRSRSRGRTRKHSRRSYTPEGYINNKKPRKTEDSAPQKLMDDLFLKTKATPSIYWQPLTPEEIATKQQQRLVRMEEHKRRIEETRGRPRDNRRIPFRRR